MLQVGFDASKENCADLRNSKVVDIIHELRSYGVEVFVHDPEADPDEAMHEYGVRLMGWDELPRKLVKGGCVIDVKSAFDPSALAAAGLRVWRL